MNKVVVTYPGVEEAEKERIRAELKFKYSSDEPDFAGGKPNYDKFRGWDTEKVLVWLNID